MWRPSIGLPLLPWEELREGSIGNFCESQFTRPNSENPAKMDIYPKLGFLLATNFNWWSFLLLAFVVSVTHCQVGEQVINNDPDTKQYLKRLICDLLCAWAIMGPPWLSGQLVQKRQKRQHDFVAGLLFQAPDAFLMLRCAFVPNYCVSAAQVMIPASDISEHISTAGTDARQQFSKFCGLLWCHLSIRRTTRRSRIVWTHRKGIRENFPLFHFFPVYGVSQYLPTLCLGSFWHIQHEVAWFDDRISHAHDTHPGGGFNFFLFSPLFWGRFPNLTNIFKWVEINHQPVIEDSYDRS